MFDDHKNITEGANTVMNTCWCWVMGYKWNCICCGCMGSCSTWSTERNSEWNEKWNVGLHN